MKRGARALRGKRELCDGRGLRDARALRGKRRFCGGGRIRDERGQSTVEFAVVTAGFLAATVALGAMWHTFGGGTLIEHALSVASHHVQSAALVSIADIFLY